MSRYFNYTEDDYIAHFGIKGQKWGVRQYQNSDGSLSPTGKSRYDKKSDHQLKLEAKYQQKGKSKAEAEAAAKKRIKVEKTIAASAGIALGTAATVALIKKYKDYADDIIVGTKDQPIYRMEMMNDTKEHNTAGAVYGVYKKKDTPQYFGILAKQKSQALKYDISNLNRPKSAHAMKMAYDSGVKMASTKNSRKIFKDLMKNDPTFKKNVENMPGRDLRNLQDKFEFKKRDRYDTFIRDLASTGAKGSGRDTPAAKQFFGELSKRGYGAIHDSNDVKFSGFGAKSAGIFFKDGYDWSAKKLSDQEIEDNAKIGKRIITKEAFKQFLRFMAPGAAIEVGGTVALSRTKANRTRSLKKAGISKSDIAKQLHISESEVDKLLSEPSQTQNNKKR